MKRYSILLLLCSLLVLAGPAQAIMVNLTQNDCEEAIAFGTEHKDTIDKMLQQRYSKGNLTEFDEGLIVHTKWYKLALLAAIKAQKAEQLTAEEKSDILSDPSFQLDIVVHGHRMDFAEGFKVFLLQRGVEIKPEKTHANDYVNHRAAQKFMSGFPCYHANLRTYFRYDQFDPTAHSILVVKKNGKECRFEVDFSRFK